MKGAVKIEATIKAMPGDLVMVLNYRLKPARWEPGIVHHVRIGVRPGPVTRNSYEVRTTRLVYSRRRPEGRPVWLTVADDSIAEHE